MSRFAACWAALLLISMTLALGCAREPGPLWADPGVVRFDANRTEVDVTIHNVSGAARPIGDFALTGEDWGSLRFVDPSLPRTVPPNDAVVVRLAISRASLRVEPGVYRSGHASLVFRSDSHAFEVPIEFVGTQQRRSGAPPAWLAIGLLALIGLAPMLIPRGRSELLARLGSARASGRARDRFAVAGALASLLLLVASVPFGAGLCRARSGARVGPAELAQCRDGLGGFELTLLPAEPGLWWWVIALALAAALLGLVRARSCAASVALAFVRALGFGLILAGLIVGLAPASTSAVELALAQLRRELFGSLPLPAWGLVAQPIACAATLALALSSPRRATEPNQDPLRAALERLEQLAWAALITVVFLGAWSIPGVSDRPVPPLSHAGMLAAELLAFAGKLALVDLALRRLGALLEQRAVTPAELLRAHARWTIPIVLAHLIALMIWQQM